jgi:selenocysteine lyase/cysteine desulfurase
MASAEAVYSVREKAAAFFGAEPDNVVFTSNCTHSLNIAIKGIAENAKTSQDGCHIIISDLEHNSVLRPVHALQSMGCSYDIAHVSCDDDETAANFESLIKPSTRLIVCTLGSNVTGRILPYRKIGEICRRHGICFIADGAQYCGIRDVKLSDGINILCAPGHKSLYGPSGTGLLLTDGSFDIAPLMQGGTGSTSLEPFQPDFMPDALESGTVNTCGIVSLGAGIDFVNSLGTERIMRHEEELCDRFMSNIGSLDRVILYRGDGDFLPVVSFNIIGMTANETAGKLSDAGFALRGGLHCSGLAHKALGTAPEGTVRFSPSVFNTVKQVDSLSDVIESIVKSGR